MYANASARRYQQVSVQTSSPGQILVSLYETAVRYARQGAESIRRGDIPAKARELQRVSDIVGELTSTLNRSVAPELCDNLERLYYYMQEKVAEGNATMKPEPVEEVARLLDTLREAWVEAVAQVEGRK
ncbi:MAG: flagellar export chaperone FliS [Deltaproteobacteria bacterium]|nr:flagellar export chaperone FliS [Deltaproteobacteria bacterium]